MLHNATPWVGENHTASTPYTISEIRTSCSGAQYNSKTRVLREVWQRGKSSTTVSRTRRTESVSAGQTLVQSPYFRQTAPELWWLSRVCRDLQSYWRAFAGAPSGLMAAAST